MVSREHKVPNWKCHKFSEKLCTTAPSLDIRLRFGNTRSVYSPCTVGVTYGRYKWINYPPEYNRPVNFICPGRFNYVTTVSQRNRA